MLVRQLQSHCTRRVTLLKSCLEKHQINHNSKRLKSITQWWNKVWQTFDGEVIKPPYKHCVQVGDPVLRCRAAEVPVEKIKSDEVQQLIKQMKNVLHHYNLLGLAAPQIGVSSRVIIMEATEQLREKYPKDVYTNRQMSILPLTTFINPVLQVKNFNIKMFPEGCGSVCGYSGDVKRYEEVLLNGFNENGDAIEMHLKGWNARIAQHDMDHLNGQIFIDIMEKKTFSCVTWQAVNATGGQIHIPFYPPKKRLPINLNPAKKSTVT
ncbi:peptide deformylase, mitochondrial-like [Contarinia nasturtii]|uniref:peptide deformylase, mitochondrial-like n=1 Tax=Contarinia nasturtii TaxID=265458 RepID=UPI0012D3F9A0|nr:peptide deformylase, mitochondrial-like [Contarinia nasturtii]